MERASGKRHNSPPDQPRMSRTDKTSRGARQVKRTAHTTTGRALAMLAVGIVAGCASSGSDSDLDGVREEILAHASGVDDVLIRFDTDVFSQKVVIALSMTTTDAEDATAITGAIDATLRSAWFETDFEPSSVRVAVALAPFAEDDTAGDVDGISLANATEGSDLPGRASSRSFVAQTSSLVAAYGPRENS